MRPHRRTRRHVMWGLWCAALLLPGLLSAADLPRGTPDEVGFDPAKLTGIAPRIDGAIAEGKLPGAVLAFGRKGKLVWLEAYGQRRLEPTPEPMTVDTVFDLASLTKPVATATAILQLIEQHRLDLTQRVATVIPEFGVNGKDAITIQDLLIHQSGLIADNALADYQHGIPEAWRRIYDLPLKHPVGSQFVYSDVNFLMLGACVERTTGQRLHDYTRRHIFEPLGMTETGYLPAEPLRARAAPTQQRADRWLQGEVHDPRAALLAGVAGHAGLFGTATDLARYAQMVLNEGELEGTRILTPATITLMTAPYPVSSGIRGLGWDKASKYSSNKAVGLSDRAIGHGGFTGTVLWIDPGRDLYYIFLSNRVHPNGKGLVNPLAGELGTIIVKALREGM